MAADTPPETPSWEKRTDQWFESIESGGRVRIINPHGSIYARFGGYEPQVELLATVQRIDHDLPELEVRRERTGDGITVTVAFGKPLEPAVAAAHRDRIDLVVFVPLGSTLDAETLDGRSEAKGLKSDLIARSIKGDLFVRSIAGRLQLETQRGDISATLVGGATVEPQQLTTRTGDIEAYLWEDADFEVEIATSGEISTDFSLTVEHLRYEEPGKRARASIGVEGPELRLSSKRGRVRLLRLQRTSKPDDS